MLTPVAIDRNDQLGVPSTVRGGFAEQRAPGDDEPVGDPDAAITVYRTVSFWRELRI